MIRRLQRKYIAAAMLSLLAVLIVLVALINGLNLYNTVTEADRTLALLAENGGGFPMHEWMTDSQPPDEWRGGRRNDSGELQFQSRWFSVTLDETGAASACDLNHIATVDETTAVEMATAAQARGHFKGFSGSYRYIGVPSNGATQWIFLNCERELGTFRDFLLVSCLISLGGFLAVSALFALLSRRIVRPIAQSYEKQKQFITDAGHELKTPITIINADADVLEESVPDSEWIGDIRKQTARLKQLTENLVFLSKMEEERATPLMIDFPLSEVAEDTAQSFAAVALTKEQTFTVAIQPLLTMRGDAASVRRLLTILLDNAVKYTPAHGSIAFSLKRSGRQLRLTVENSAEGLEKGNYDRLFDRFYRSDASRNSETGGFGLGLAVAKAVTEAHNGRIRAYSPDGRTLTVEAIFAAQGD